LKQDGAAVVAAIVPGLNKQNLAQEIETRDYSAWLGELARLNKQNLAQEIETPKTGTRRTKRTRLEQTESRSRD